MGGGTPGRIFFCCSLTNNGIFCNMQTMIRWKVIHAQAPQTSTSSPSAASIQSQLPWRICSSVAVSVDTKAQVVLPLTRIPRSPFLGPGGQVGEKTDHGAAADLYFLSGSGDSYWLAGWMSLSLCFKWLECMSALGKCHSSTVTRRVRSAVLWDLSAFPVLVRWHLSVTPSLVLGKWVFWSPEGGVCQWGHCKVSDSLYWVSHQSGWWHTC